ncbi:unnamed protein product [Paramecium primaurelia]|uniref:Transmembrane protein n=1 Tax=Paramecium primaurelia TaxID=5886 RepID=A0A8S1M3B6_PARPR|nr:unnamed protein product [Paramecium primaurelia]
MINYQNYAQYNNTQNNQNNTQNLNPQPQQNGYQFSNQNIHNQNMYQQNMVQPANYPKLNFEKESFSEDQPDHIIHHDYLQQQQVTQQQEPYQQYNNNDNQTQYIYVNQQIATPFIQPENENNQDIMTEHLRRNLIYKINFFWIIQQTVQIILCIINMASYSYDNLFFDYSLVQYRITIYIFLFLSFGYMLVIRFIKPLWRIRGYQSIIYIIYTILYSFFISGIVSSSHLSFYKNKMYFLIGFLYFIGTIGILIMLIQFQFQIKHFKEEDMKLKEFIKGVILGPIGILFLITAIFGVDAVSMVLCYELIWSYIFTLFYINSLLQIYRGKFKLKRDQHFVGVILVYINMFIPCIP